MIQRMTEADARIEIDDMLRKADWDPKDKSMVTTEVSIKWPSVIGQPSVNYGERNLSNNLQGRADYVLFDGRGRPLAVVEAKRKGIDPYVAKQQVLPYAKQLEAPFIFLTNGEIIYFWDYQNDDARIVDSFFSRRDLERLVEMRSSQKPMATIAIPDYYIRNGESRKVRDYQQNAMRALDQSIELGKRRFLIELPTGTGKTDLIGLYLKRLFEAGRAERILFLVDREQLAKQALEAIQDILQGHPSYWLKSGVEKQEMQITVALLQTMIGKVEEFSSGYFDVVITDECHRSIYDSWQTALTHFDAFHIGLTATPAAYIERNTFSFYQCKNNTPDFSYPIKEAFKEGHLIRYKFATGITKILAEGADVDGELKDPAEFERKWTNEDTNRKMMQEFDRLAWENYKELAPGQKTAPGKSIVFAISKHHAARLTRYLNDLHPECNGRYAEVITSDVPNADELIRRFKKEPYPQVAVSVGMLDTGFDCREVLHLVLCRRIHSPIMYQQIRGRGTRNAPHIGKNRFVIYDFFGNHEYFNDSDEDIFTGYGQGHSPNSAEKIYKPKTELEDLGLIDEWLHYVTYVEVGTEGERVDKREYVTNWEKTIKTKVKNDPILIKVRDGIDLTEEEEEILAKKLNSPEMFFNEENLRRAYRDPEGNLINFIKHALGTFKVKSREEKLTENFNAWLVSQALAPKQAEYLSLLKNRGIIKGKIEIDDLFSPPLSILNAADIGIQLFGENGLKRIINEMNEQVFNTKMA